MSCTLELGRVILVDTHPKLSIEDICRGLKRHRKGDWGDISRDQWMSNAVAFLKGSGLIQSTYLAPNGLKFSVITEWDRSYTLVQLTGSDF